MGYKEGEDSINSRLLREQGGVEFANLANDFYPVKPEGGHF